ncbi:MAG TPA: hypothetical protein VI997_02230, partial [Candidatus Thermoplasmatota archaeon]|nr:hypothetical protein [Candidatus Thermoplasmatota archaeon]
MLAAVMEAFGRLALWRGYERELTTLGIYAFGVAVYTTVVFAFYENVSRTRSLPVRRDGPLGRLLRVAETGLVMPAFAFFYFAVLAAALFGLAKSQGTFQILMVALAVAASVRVTAFLHPNLANDLAKIVPLGLLGVVLADPGYLTLGLVRDRFLEAAAAWPLLGRAFVFLVVLEAFLRLVRHLA